jgi:hypothetical protein
MISSAKYRQTVCLSASATVWQSFVVIQSDIKSINSLKIQSWETYFT